MRKSILIALAVAMVVALGGGAVLAGSNGQGVPSAKCSADWAKADYDPGVHNVWKNVRGLRAQIKTSEQADLIISVTAECALATDVKIKGKGTEDTSESLAQIKIRALVKIDGDWVVAQPGDVVFAYRKMILKGLLWDETQVVPAETVVLPEQYIEIYEETRTANGFNFVLKNVGQGVHDVKVQIMTDTAKGFDEANVAAVIGKRTLVVEAVRMVND